VRNGEAKGNVMMKANLPGLERKDVNVSVSGNILTIKGEKKKETEK
jgi:HSP20 family protein